MCVITMTLINVITFTFLPSDWLRNQLSAKGGLYYVERVGFWTRMGADHMGYRSTVIYIYPYGRLRRLISVAAVTWHSLQLYIVARIDYNRRPHLVNGSRNGRRLKVSPIGDMRHVHVTHRACLSCLSISGACTCSFLYRVHII